METLYAHPKYYEIAFSFRNILEEVDVFEELITRYARIPVTWMLEVGCGNSPHLEELVKRGYEYTGIDLSQAMLDYTRAKVSHLDTPIELIQANMVDFDLDHQVEFAYIMLGSLFVTNTVELKSHFNSMGYAIKSGGLYLLDWCVQFAPLSEKEDTWEMKQDGINVITTYAALPLNTIEQTFEERITLQVDDHGQHKEFRDISIKRAIFPQEFLLLIDDRDDFEFIGWWNNWNPAKPLQGTENISRPIILLRRT